MNGILLLDKPAGWTSMDVCAKLRGALGEKRIGHGGTLDPMATGLLVVFLGRATRAVEFAESHSKTYEAALRLGLTTDTQDTSGKPLSDTRPVTVTGAALEGDIARFRGDISPVPPMYSASKSKGQKLYTLARRGREVERAPRPVTIHALDCLGRSPDGDILLHVHCSKGTYIRTLCHDIGQALGCGGCMSALRRTGCGDFSIARAHTLEEVLSATGEGRAEALLLPVEALFSGTERTVLTDAQAKRIRAGGRYSCPLPAGRWLLYDGAGAFLALGETAGGEMRAIKSFFEVER